MGRDQWLQLRAVQRTGKLNKFISVPAFSASCGPAKACMKTIATSIANPAFFYVGAGSEFQFTATGYTFSFWLFPSKVSNISTKFADIDINGGGTDFNFGVSSTTGNFVIYGLNDLGTPLDTGVKVDYTQWQNITFSRTSSGATTTIKFYKNGILLFTSSGTFAVTSGTITNFMLGATLADGVLFSGKYDDARVWLPAQSDEVILQTYNKIIGKGYSALKLIYRINEQSGLTLTPVMQNFDDTAKAILNGTTQTIDLTDKAPLVFGASFICNQIAIAASVKTSIVFPVIPPALVNHSLCVSWIDDNGVFQRRKLYKALQGNEDIQPDPVIYTGEVLATNFNLEVWNVDGNSTADLATALNIFLSPITLPINERDHTNIALTTLSNNANIFATFPWANAGANFNQALAIN